MAPDSITWLGHAGVTLDLGGTRLLTDPALRNHLGPLRRVGPAPDPVTWAEADGVLISHLHHDHLDLPSLRLIPPDVPVVVPAGGRALLERRAIRHDVREVRPGDEVSIGGIRITATPAHHPPDRLGSRATGRPVGYLIRSDSGTVWFAGDTGAFPAMRDISGLVDLALLPVGGWGPTLGPEHLDPRQAAGVAALVGPRRAVPIHWGTLLLPGLRTALPERTVHAGERFREWSAQVAGDTDVVVLAPGGSTGMP